MKTVKQVIDRPQLEIRYDSDAESPRDWSNAGYFITVERNCYSPDKEASLEYAVKSTGEYVNSCDEHIAEIKKYLETSFSEKVLYIAPVSKYEHSGVIYRRGERHGWDEGVVGFYIITDKTWSENVDKNDTWKGDKEHMDHAERCIDAELETYTQWANGEVYGFILYNKDGEHEDSCWGFYSLDDIKDHLPEEWKDEDLSDYLKY
jgi:hypothetical protein